jgi:hypothetical protein
VRVEKVWRKWKKEGKRVEENEKGKDKKAG